MRGHVLLSARVHSVYANIMWGIELLHACCITLREQCEGMQLLTNTMKFALQPDLKQHNQGSSEGPGQKAHVIEALESHMNAVTVQNQCDRWLASLVSIAAMLSCLSHAASEAVSCSIITQGMLLHLQQLLHNTTGIRKD